MFCLLKNLKKQKIHCFPQLTPIQLLSPMKPFWSLLGSWLLLLFVHGISLADLTEVNTSPALSCSLFLTTIQVEKKLDSQSP